MKFAIVGYGNLGKSLEKEIAQRGDMQLAAVYSRRNICHDKYRPLKRINDECDFDVALLALGSYGDMLGCADLFARIDTVDSFDTHAKIADYKQYLRTIKKDNLSVISTGWDPGLLSLARGVFGIGASSVTTMWGEGVSQGHSNAVRSIAGVLDAVQFTRPKDNARQLAAQGVTDGKALHDRICYVACADADREAIELEIKSMPDYFVGYDTQVVFCTQQQVRALKKRTHHRGQVICRGEGFECATEINIDCNTQYTAKIMLEYAKIIPQLKRDGFVGAADVFDIPLKYLAPSSMI